MDLSFNFNSSFSRSVMSSEKDTPSSTQESSASSGSETSSGPSSHSSHSGDEIVVVSSRDVESEIQVIEQPIDHKSEAEGVGMPTGGGGGNGTSEG